MPKEWITDSFFVTYVESPTNKIQHARDKKAVIDALKVSSFFRGVPTKLPSYRFF